VQGRRSRVERIIAEARKRGDGRRVLSPTAGWIRERVFSVLPRVSGERMNELDVLLQDRLGELKH
jgi:hypothetical protein